MTRVVLTLLATLALLVGGANVPASAGHPYYGKLSRHDGVLRAGCHHYRYHYALTPHAKDWSIELFLVGPSGKGLGSDAFQSGQRPRIGHRQFKICRQTTRPGLFKVRGKLHRYVQQCDTPLTCETVEKTVWIKPARFRLRHR